MNHVKHFERKNLVFTDIFPQPTYYQWVKQVEVDHYKYDNIKPKKISQLD